MSSAGYQAKVTLSSIQTAIRIQSHNAINYCGLINAKVPAHKHIAAAVCRRADASDSAIKTAPHAKRRIHRAIAVQADDAVAGAAAVGGKVPTQIHIAATVCRRAEAIDSVIKTAPHVKRRIHRAIAVQTDDAVAGAAVVVGKKTTHIHIAAAVCRRAEAKDNVIKTAPHVKRGIHRAIAVQADDAVAGAAVVAGKGPPHTHRRCRLSPY